MKKYLIIITLFFSSHSNGISGIQIVKKTIEAAKAAQPYVKPSTKIVAGVIVTVPMTIKLAINIGAHVKEVIRYLTEEEEELGFGGLPVRFCCKLHESSDRMYWKNGRRSPYWNGTGPIMLKPFVLDCLGTINDCHPERLFYAAAIWAGKGLTSEGIRELKALCSK